MRNSSTRRRANSLTAPLPTTSFRLPPTFRTSLLSMSKRRGRTRSLVQKVLAKPGTTGAVGAVLNAVNDAIRPLGAKITELPMTPARLLKALGRLQSNAKETWMRTKEWPTGSKIHVSELKCAAIFPWLGELARDWQGHDQVSLDFVIDDGKIAAILPRGSESQAPVFDADGGQAWPPFADLHTHLDKGQIWPRASNKDGTLDVARAMMRADTLANWKAEDVSSPFRVCAQIRLCPRNECDSHAHRLLCPGTSLQ